MFSICALPVVSISAFDETMKIMRTLLVPLLLLGLWQLVTGYGLISSYLLPSPAATLDTAYNLLLNGQLLKNTIASLKRVAQGFCISIFAGCLFAWLLTMLPALEKALDPLLNFLRMTPPLAMIPLLILWFGIGEATQLAIIILASFFPVFLNARAGFSSLSPAYRELARSLSVNRLDYALYFVWPAAFPSIITGIRLSFGYSWRALIAAELIAAGSGLGYMIADAEELQRVDIVLVGIFAIGIIGWGLDALFRHFVGRLAGRRFPELLQS